MTEHHCVNPQPGVECHPGRACSMPCALHQLKQALVELGVELLAHVRPWMIWTLGILWLTLFVIAAADAFGQVFA